MPKAIDDTFEKLLELGGQTGKKAKKAAASVVQKTVSDLTGNYAVPERGNGQSEQNYTPLTQEKLAHLDKVQQNKREDEVKKRLLREFFSDRKREEKEVVAKITAAKQEKQSKPLIESQHKNGNENQKLGPVVTSKGKKRRSFLQRVVKSSQPETRGAAGKF